MIKKILFVSAVVVSLIILKIIQDSSKESKVCFEDHCFYVELAKTGEERSQGLMFRRNMELDGGMLFIFDSEREYPFWMKNTFIPLDIIWISKDKEVVFIERNTQPCQEECPSIEPGERAQYVLEINTGMADGIEAGDRAEFYLE